MKKLYKAILIGLLVAAIATITTCILVETAPVSRTHKATKYGLGCVTIVESKPLERCKYEN